MNTITMKYPHGLTKALTLSYDDGVIQDIRMIGLMKKYGIKGTFNINSGLFAPEEVKNDPNRTSGRMTESEVCETYVNSGMEVAVHGFKHLHIADVTAEEADEDVRLDRLNLEKLFKRPIRGMAYPFGQYNDTVIGILKKNGILFSRTTQSTHKFGFPENRLALHPTCHHNDAKLFELTDRFIAAEPSEPIMFYLWGHTYEFDKDNNWERIIGFFEKISRRDDIWYATNMEIYSYIAAFEALEFSLENEYVYNSTATDVWFECGGKTFCAPGGKVTEI